MLVFVVLLRRNAGEYREILNEVYVRDPDDLGVPPAVAGYVSRSCEPSGDDLAATAMDLIARGVVVLDEDAGYRASRSRLALRRERATGLWPHEVAALALLLAPCGRLCPFASLDMLHRLHWRDRRAYDERVAEFGCCVAEEVHDLGLSFEAYGFAVAQMASAVSVVMLVFACIASGLTQSWVYEVSGLVLAGSFIVFDRTTYRRSRPGRILQLRCAHLRRYWHDFGRLGEKHLDETELWGRHLAFAVALGDATLARRELHDPGERLVRVADTLAADPRTADGRPAVDVSPDVTMTGALTAVILAVDASVAALGEGDEDIGGLVDDGDDDGDDARIAEWLRTLDLPETALVGMST